MEQFKVAKWGNSLAIRSPSKIVRELGLKEGDIVSREALGIPRSIAKMTREEALVLEGFIARFEETDQLVMKHNAEYIALMRISAQLDKSLVEVFQPDYATKLNKAQQAVAAGYEGVAPGVLPP